MNYKISKLKNEKKKILPMFCPDNLCVETSARFLSRIYENFPKSLNYNKQILYSKTNHQTY